MSQRPGDVYESALKERRNQFANGPVVREMVSFGVKPKRLELFTICHSALSSGFVGPIATFIKGAAKRCEELGFNDVVGFFNEHAEEEDGHDKWAADDVARLVTLWNKRHKDKLDTKELLSHAMSPAVKRYHAMHKRVINGKTPYAELAIDVEIEIIPVKFGPRFLLNCLLKLGPKFTSNLSFIREHLKFDIGHSKHNKEVVNDLLTKHPEYAPALIEAGLEALDVYSDLLDDCIKLTNEKYVS